MRLEGDTYRQVAQTSNHPAEVTEFFARNPVRPGGGSVAGRVALERRPVHIENIQNEPGYEAREVVRDVRTILVLRYS
jgi:two-component system, NtrC family, sensor kinase